MALIVQHSHHRLRLRLHRKRLLFSVTPNGWLITSHQHVEYILLRLFTVILPVPGTKRTRATAFYDGLCRYIVLIVNFPP